MRMSILRSGISKGTTGEALAGKPTNPLWDVWRQFSRRAVSVVCLAVLILLVVMAIAAPLLTSYNPDRSQFQSALQDPSVQHPLGTDFLGRDILARLLYGGRYSLSIGFLAVAVGLAVGVILGAVSGYYGGLIDMLVQRFVDLLLSFPTFLLALSLVATLGPGLNNVIISVAVGSLPFFIRLVRASTLSIRSQTYVDAARAVGANDRRIVLRHILPNAMAPVIVQATLYLGNALMLAAGLGFLGLGVKPPTAEWGTMLGDGRQYIFSNPNLATLPGLAIFITVVAFNQVGDGLRDALDPRLRGS